MLPIIRAALLLTLCLLPACTDGAAPGGRSSGGSIVALSLDEPGPVVPAYLAAVTPEMTQEALDTLQQVPGVATVAAVNSTSTTVRVAGAEHEARVATIDPLVFRSVAPPRARDADFVWEALLSGRVVVTFDAARRLDLEDGGSMVLPGAGRIEVAAIATHSLPNLADVIVMDDYTDELGIIDTDIVAVGARPGADIDSIGKAIRAALPLEELRRLPPDLGAFASESPVWVGGRQSAIAAMSFRPAEDGFIDPDERWVDTNISRTPVPVLGEVVCNRLMIPQLGRVLAEIEAQGLSSLIDPADYGGCYVPRFIDRDPSNPLSMHAFGLAVDLNVSANPLGTKGSMDPRVVEIFERWGFEWGGGWSRPDPMHFELHRLMQT